MTGLTEIVVIICDRVRKESRLNESYGYGQKDALDNATESARKTIGGAKTPLGASFISGIARPFEPGDVMWKRPHGSGIAAGCLVELTRLRGDCPWHDECDEWDGAPVDNRGNRLDVLPMWDICERDFEALR